MRTMLKMYTVPWFSNQEQYEDIQYKLNPSYDPDLDNYVAPINGPYSESPWSHTINKNFYVINSLFGLSIYPDDSDVNVYPHLYSIDDNKTITINVSGDYRIQMDTKLNCRFYGLAQNIKVELIKRNTYGDVVIDSVEILDVKSDMTTENDTTIIFDTTHSFLVGDMVVFKVTALGSSYTVTKVEDNPVITNTVINSSVYLSNIRTSGYYTIQIV